MTDFRAVSRQLAEEFRPGEHELDNAQLRELYGVRRVTSKSRAAIAESLLDAELEVLSDPRDEPLVLRKTRSAGAVVAGGGESKRPVYRRPWAIAVGAVVALLVLVAAISPASNKNSERASSAAATPTATPTPTPTATPTSTPSPQERTKEAEGLVADDDYAGAIAVVAGLSARDRNRVRRTISRRLASRARRALRSGSRSSARTLISQSRRYPSTPQIRVAGAALDAADTRATQRAQARKEAREQRAEARREAAKERREARERARAEREAEEEAPEGSGGGFGGGSAPSVGEGTCAEVGETNFPVPPGDERDADGDGIACES